MVPLSHEAELRTLPTALPHSEDEQLRTQMPSNGGSSQSQSMLKVPEPPADEIVAEAGAAR